MIPKQCTGLLVYCFGIMCECDLFRHKPYIIMN